MQRYFAPYSVTEENAFLLTGEDYRHIIKSDANERRRSNYLC